MKRFGIVIIILCVFLMGIILGKPSQDIVQYDLEERLNQFEKDIVTPGNNYTPIYDADFDPNLANTLGKSGENLLTGIFDFIFKIVKNVLD